MAGTERLRRIPRTDVRNWLKASLPMRGVVSCVMVAAAALSINVLEAVPASAQPGHLSTWLAMDGNIRYTPNASINNQFGWASENAGTTNPCTGSEVNVPGVHGLFDCGAPGATGFEPAPALPDNGDASIINRAFLSDPSLGQTTTGCPAGSGDTTHYKGGQEFGLSASYATATGSVNPTSTDLSNLYLVARTQQAGNTYDPSPGDKELFFGLERASLGGDVGLSLEFLQDPGAGMSGCNGPLAMPRTQGDFAVELGWTTGGSVVISSFLVWECTGTATGNPPVGTPCNPGSGARYVAVTPPAGSLAVAGNTTTSVSCGGWVCAQNPVPATQFIEGGLDLSGLGVAATCTGTVIASSQSSQSITSNLEDFVSGAFDLCPATTTVTSPSAPAQTTVGSSWSDTATVTGVPGGGPPSGIVAFYSCSPSQMSAAGVTTCSAGVGTQVPSGGGITNPVTLTPGTGDTSSATSPPITPDETGTWCFAGYYLGETRVFSGSSDTSTDECFVVTAATPTMTTSLVAPADNAVGNSWSDSATVTGNDVGGAPTGSVTFTVCPVIPPNSSCTGGPKVGTVTTPTSTTSNSSTFTLPVDAVTPANVGTYCFNASYTAASGGNYADVLEQTGSECFMVTPAPSTTATQQSTTTAGLGSVSIGATGTITDRVTVTGNPTGGPPSGAVTFTICGPTPVPQPCNTGTQVGAIKTLGATGPDTSGVTSDALGPITQVGTYCFAAVYTPDTTSNYLGSSDNMGTITDRNECVVVHPAAPGFTTTILPPSDSSLGNSWSDTATLVGNSDGGAPSGTVTWTLCRVLLRNTSCTGGAVVGTDSSPTSTATTSTFTLPTPTTPSAAGTYCFNASYTATPTGNYHSLGQQTGEECFTVTPLMSSTTTTASTGSIVIGPTGTVTDQVFVAGTPTGGAPDGMVAFTVCGALSGPELCPGGAEVSTEMLIRPAAGDTSTATSAPFTPTNVGTWCFAAVYTPAAGSNYFGSSDNVTGVGPDQVECFTVTAATVTMTSTILPPSDTSLGNTWGDTATVVGNAAGGAPEGTVTWTLCEVKAPATSCTGGGTVGSDSSPTTSGATSTFTLPNPQTPTTEGAYCFNESYVAASSGNYLPVERQAGIECFTVTNPVPNFTVTKTSKVANGGPLMPGAVIDYEVVIENVGDLMGSAVVTDTIPPQVTLTGAPTCAVTAPDVCTVVNSTGTTWAFSVTLAPKHGATVTYAARVTAASGTIVNTATITTGPCVVSDACSASVSDPIATVPSDAPGSTSVSPPATLAAAFPASAAAPAPALTGAYVGRTVLGGLALVGTGGAMALASRRRRRDRHLG